VTARGAGPDSIPLVLQRTETDCGAACLAMVLAWHGRTIALDELRRAVEETDGGAHAAALLRAARRYGLSGRGFHVERIDALRSLPRASILHWRVHHYVVLDRLDSAGIAWLVDPARGPRRACPDELEREFTRVALVFEPPRGR
jgi:ATP-binding cassette, subfamily B, bacterial